MSVQQSTVTRIVISFFNSRGVQLRKYGKWKAENKIGDTISERKHQSIASTTQQGRSRLSSAN